MRRKLAKHVRQRVEEFVRTELPGFVNDSKTPIPPGCRLFVWRASERLWWYVFLTVLPDRDYFRLQLMWSTREGFPATSGGLPWPPEENILIAFSHLGMPPGTKMISIDGGHDVSPVRTPKGPDDVTWLDPVPLEEAQRNADAALDADLEEMRKFGFQYIRQVSEERGEAPDFTVVFKVP